MNTVDYGARVEELARHLAAHYDRRTLALFIAGDALLPALRKAYGNPAMRDVGALVAGAVAAFQRELLQTALDAKRRAKAAAAEAVFTVNRAGDPVPAEAKRAAERVAAMASGRRTLTLRPAGPSPAKESAP